MNDYRYDEQQSLWGERRVIGFGSESFYVEVLDRHIANEIIRGNHYAGTVTQGSYIHLAVYVHGFMSGVLQFGPAMNPASCSTLVPGTEQDQYLELNRMWLDDSAPRNSESRAIGYAIRYIKRAYPRVKWIQSFADERCGGLGIVYQACSFDYYGEHTSTFWELDGQWFHNKAMTIIDPDKRTAKEAHLQANRDRAIAHRLRQFRYIRWIDRRWADRCTLKRKPYPKHYLEAANDSAPRAIAGGAPAPPSG